MGRRMGEHGSGQRALARRHASYAHKALARPPAANQITNHKSEIRNPSGFTLIELLVVLAIIALLMAILLPTLSRVRRQAKAVVCQANLRQWGAILAQYLEENQGSFPTDLGASAWLLRGGSPTDEAVQVKPFATHTEGIARCPMAVKPGYHGIEVRWMRYFEGGDKMWQVSVALGSTFEAWEIVDPEPPFRASYGMNENLSRRDFLSLVGPGARKANVFGIREGSHVPVLLDCVTPGSDPQETDRPPPEPALWNVSQMGEFCIDRHDAHVNALFLDWSIRKVGVKELWTLKWRQDFDRGGPWTKAGGVAPNDWPAWMRTFEDY